eukprot:TRINITY_DN16718_c0_g1_i6.p1 TRINITY_DN16718_c0_g1~~TRINITY_DN16718_c0_g1_i6.p1  ORF type:complete len:311 (+),score=78.37 TRINITY_DN16718_c0_g1_i6:127-1059(+)
MRIQASSFRESISRSMLAECSTECFKPSWIKLRWMETRPRAKRLRGSRTSTLNKKLMLRRITCYKMEKESDDIILSSARRQLSSQVLRKRMLDSHAGDNVEPVRKAQKSSANQEEVVLSSCRDSMEIAVSNLGEATALLDCGAKCISELITYLSRLDVIRLKLHRRRSNLEMKLSELRNKSGANKMFCQLRNLFKYVGEFKNVHPGDLWEHLQKDPLFRPLLSSLNLPEETEMDIKKKKPFPILQKLAHVSPEEFHFCIVDFEPMLLSIKFVLDFLISSSSSQIEFCLKVFSESITVDIEDLNFSTQLDS